MLPFTVIICIFKIVFAVSVNADQDCLHKLRKNRASYEMISVLVKALDVSTYFCFFFSSWIDKQILTSNVWSRNPFLIWLWENNLWTRNCSASLSPVWIVPSDNSVAGLHDTLIDLLKGSLKRFVFNRIKRSRNSAGSHTVHDSRATKKLSQNVEDCHCRVCLPLRCRLRHSLQGLR